MLIYFLYGLKKIKMQLFNKLSSLTEQRLIMPFYHAVTDDVPTHLKHLYNVRSVKKFEHDLDFLLKHYVPISIDDIYNYLQGVKELPKYSFFISFDDGLTEFKEYAWPILKRKGVPATLFVNPNFVDNKDLFFRFKASILIDFIENNSDNKKLSEVREHFTSAIYKSQNVESYIMNIGFEERQLLDDLALNFNIDFNDYLKKQQPYLSTNDLLELNSQGVHIGAHSLDHPLFNELNEHDRLNQLTDSIKWVSESFKQQLKSFSFPFTDYGIDASFFKIVFNKEKPLANLTFGTAGLKNEQFKYHLQRIPVEDNDNSMQKILLKQYLYYMAKAPLLKNTIRR